MMYPYAEFLIDFDRKHGGLTHENYPENTRAAVIVETRPFFFLPKVIRNVMYFLGPRWNLHIFSGERSHDYIERSLKGWNVRVTKFPGLFGLSVAGYNGIMLSPTFWQQFREEKLLVFQSDSILTADHIEDFMAYDFIGAPCGPEGERFVANGGLSLRSRRVMLDVSRAADPPKVRRKTCSSPTRHASSGRHSPMCARLPALRSKASIPSTQSVCMEPTSAFTRRKLPR